MGVVVGFSSEDKPLHQATPRHAVGGGALRMPLSGWGRHPVIDCLVHRPSDDSALARCVAGSPVIARGAGRAYGDSALQPTGTILTAGLGGRIELDPGSGVLECDSGVNFADVIAHALPAGWFPPVTPGTQFVTIGGAIAADAHGKNHHVAGSFGDHVLWLDLMGADGCARRCSPIDEPELFRATIGGMGLTGVIRRAAIRMIPVETAWVRQETVVAANLDAAFDAFEASQDWTYSVAWIDALASGRNLGRALVLRGEHARIDELPPERRADPLHLPGRRAATVPFDTPSGLLNNWTARAFNMAYWTRNSHRPGARLVDCQSFFYPLDSLRDWNRLYGKPGFLQYQCVLPLAASRDGLRLLLDRIRASALGSFLAVLKLMGDGRGGMSFPMRGYTLALDFPFTRRLPQLLDALDEIVIGHGGRLYLAKDARMSAETCWRGYDNAAAFEALRRSSGAAGVFRSHQSERLGFA
jgi:decaprenylphospho-beta-D-ribofuranose 2-oxidase